MTACETGKKHAYAGKQCNELAHDKICDSAVDCCNCCELGIRTRKNGDDCTLSPVLDTHCNAVFMDCCKYATSCNSNAQFDLTWLLWRINYSDFYRQMTTVAICIFVRVAKCVRIHLMGPSANVRKASKRISLRSSALISMSAKDLTRVRLVIRAPILLVVLSAPANVAWDINWTKQQISV